jgi:hypothetical protein
VVVASEQNPWQIDAAHAAPAQSSLTWQASPSFAPPAHRFSAAQDPPSLIVPTWSVDRINPAPIPPAPEKRILVGLLHKPACAGVVEQTEPHLPPAPQSAELLQAAPRFGPEVQNSNFSRQAASPLPWGGFGSSSAQAELSSMLAHTDPGQSASVLQ